MQSYRDNPNPFGDSQGDLAHDGGAVGHQYSSPYETSSGFPGIPLVPSGASGQGEYRNVMGSQLDLGGEGAKMSHVSSSHSQWDGSRYNQGSTWVAEQEKKSRRSKIVVITGIVVLVIIIIVAVSVGVTVGRKANNNNTSKPGSSSNSNTSNPNAVNQTDPNDPSTFVKNPDLHQSFYGIAYTPVGSQLPDCGNKLADVIQDIQILSQITKRVRLYGADCNQSALVLDAIQRTKVDMTVWLGNYVIATDQGAAYERQRDVIKQAIQDFGVDHIGGITVGNEFMLNYLNANGAQLPNTPTGDQGAQILISNIQDTANMLTGMSLSKHIPVGTADAGSYFNTKVLQSIEYGMSNVHPWFANTSIDNAAAWTAQFFQEQNVDVAKTLTNNPTMYIAETGWPTKSSDAGNANNGASDASEPNLQTFIDTFVCQANSNGTGYFFFELCDEDWKDKQFGGVEGWWGLFYQNRTLKNIKIPDCQAP